jgi:hypothetical protein
MADVRGLGSAQEARGEAIWKAREVMLHWEEVESQHEGSDYVRTDPRAKITGGWLIKESSKL